MTRVFLHILFTDCGDFFVFSVEEGLDPPLRFLSSILSWIVEFFCVFHQSIYRHQRFFSPQGIHGLWVKNGSRVPFSVYNSILNTCSPQLSTNSSPAVENWGRFSTAVRLLFSTIHSWIVETFSPHTRCWGRRFTGRIYLENTKNRPRKIGGGSLNRSNQITAWGLPRPEPCPRRCRCT